MIVTNPFSPGTWTRDQIDNVSRNWWVLLLTGIIGVVAGGIILSTDWSVSDLAAFVGAVLVFQGIFTMFSVPIDGSVRGWSVVLGVLRRSSASPSGSGPAPRCWSSPSSSAGTSCSAAS